MLTLFQDVRYRLPTLRRSSGFTITVVLRPALGIGTNRAILSVVSSVLSRPLPFKSAERLVDMTEHSRGKVERTGVPYHDSLSSKQSKSAFEETAAYYLISASNDIVSGGSFSAFAAAKWGLD